MLPRSVPTIINDPGTWITDLCFIWAQLDLEGSTRYLDVLGGDANLSTTQKLSIPAQFQVGIAYEWIPNKWLAAITYDYTLNEVIKADAMTVSGFSSQPIPQFSGITSDIVSVPLHYKNGHTLHMGTEYVFDLAKEARIRTGIGLGYDREVTRNNFPSPALAPSADYYGYCIGAQYERPNDTFGLSFNYGQYKSNTDTIDPSVTAGTVYKGQYALTEAMITLDYQFKF